MRKTDLTESDSKRGTGGRNAEPTTTLSTGPALPVDSPALPLRNLARRLEDRNWACELVGDGTVLRLQPPDVGDLGRAVSTIELVHGSEPPHAPPIPKGLARAAADMDRRDSASGPALSDCGGGETVPHRIPAAVRQLPQSPPGNSS